VASEIIERPARLPAAGAKREVSVMFADLRGFTALADALDPQDVVEILSAYLAEAVEAVFEQGGTVDKFRGDGVMAVFGAPVVQPDSAERAVRCALDLQARVARLQFPRFPDLQLRLGVGINTGTAVVGPIGSPRRMDYTAIGSEVNLAQRLEASAGPGQILISDSTYRQLGPLAHVREIGLLRLSGVTRPVPTFDVLGFTAQ
jgi:adenylate cyclase